MRFREKNEFRIYLVQVEPFAFEVDEGRMVEMFGGAAWSPVAKLLLEVPSLFPPGFVLSSPPCPSFSSSLCSLPHTLSKNSFWDPRRSFRL
mmetsp:Transcript_19359/g.29715  ORF Transcript_19359/g.29715 Transcript_19359/m.29715 type:complete len:91 (+) Transcript_19359:83-355(+)